MIIEHTDSFSSYKNIRALLPSVQNKIAHNAIIKLLLDQGRDLTPPTTSPFEHLIPEWEKLFHTKQIACDALYVTDKNAYPTHAIRFSLSDDTYIDFAFDRPFGRFIVDSLLGSTPSPTENFSDLEQRILKTFCTSLLAFLPNTPTIIQTAFITTLDKNADAHTFQLKTKHLSYTFQLRTPQQHTTTESEPFYDKLWAHLTQIALPVTGVIEHTMPLSKFTDLKKGDTILLSAHASETPTTVKTFNRTWTTGKLRVSNNHLQITTEES